MTPNNTPISFFIPHLDNGGAQKVVVNLANTMFDLADRPIHIVLASAYGNFLDEVRPEVKVVDLRTRRASRSIFALARYLREEKPMVLCSSLNYANVCASLAWHLAGKPCRLVLREDNVVLAPSGSMINKFRDVVLQQLMSVLYPLADRVIAISEEVAKTLINRRICCAEDIEIIGNPVTVNFHKSFPSNGLGHIKPFDKPYIVAVGRLTHQKGFDVLIESYANLKDTTCDLVILGEGILRGELEALVQKLGLANRVHMPGFVKNPYIVISGAQLFVLSSRWEGFGLVIVEALALGTPIVATDCLGAPRELLLDGKLGHLIAPDDSNELAHAISEALTSPRGTKKERMNRATDFSPSLIAKQYLERAMGFQPK